MKYKFGDKVKIRRDLVEYKKYGSQTFVPPMAEFIGEQTIKEVRTLGYTIKADKHLCQYIWTDEMFEDKVEDNKMDNQNITVNMENLSQEERTALLSLIEKANKPKSKVWKPEKDETYYYSYSNCTIGKDTWDNANEDRNRYAIGNCFKTREEAEFALEKQKMITELKRFALEHNEKEIDWSDSHQDKYCLYFNHETNCIKTTDFCKFQYQAEQIFFTSKEIANAAIEKIGEERIKKYYFEVEE